MFNENMSKARTSTLLEETEEELSNQLKELCYANGREKQPAQSAKILHKLGIIYKAKGPDKVALIQSAALLNGAIVRCPENVTEVKKDLECLCSSVLCFAEVKKQDTNLISIAKTCLKAILQKRQEIQEALSSLQLVSETTDDHLLHKYEKNKIKSIRKIQEEITESYLSIMSSLSDYCISIMGDPPSYCRFALVGMGSLARKEVTPYSDFENVIVLEEGAKQKKNYGDIVEYFRWFAVIFQIVLINLGETIIPSVAIPSLNDFTQPGGDWFFDAFTPCGVSFDGLMPHACKSPLGRQFSTQKKAWKTELIKTVSEMAKYLDSDEDLKNGYHLADVLSKTCFVSGDKKVYEEFNSRVTAKLALRRKQDKTFVENLKRQILDDKLKFDINDNCSNIYITHKFNIKTVIYRSTTIFISALGTFHGLEETSCFDIIEKLFEKKVISRSERHCLSYAVAIACEVRLKIYLKRKRQSDWVEDDCNVSQDCSEIIQTVGGKCIADYFTIARGFQTAMSNLTLVGMNQPFQLNLTLDYKYSVDICCKLRLHKTCIQVCSSTLRNQRQLLSQEDEASCYYYQGISLLDLGNSSYALKRFKKELKIRKKLSPDVDNPIIADCYYNIGRCFIFMERYEEALYNFQLELCIREEMTKTDGTEMDIAFCEREIGLCMFNLHRYNDALVQFERALHLYQNNTKNKAADVYIIYCISQIGESLSRLGRYNEALSRFEVELEKRRKHSNDEERDLNVAECLDRIGMCILNMDRFADALCYFEQSLFIRKQVATNKVRNEYIAKCIYNISICKQFIDNKSINTS